MRRRFRPITATKWSVLRMMVLVLTTACMFGPVQTVHADEPFSTENFVRAAPQGFGDRNNTWAWSMKWWRGYLYVGTNYAFRCAEDASLHLLVPFLFPYPPNDPDVECAESPEDQRLQAEIWRWSPQTETWQRLFQSPNDVPIPGKPGKYTARDIGFRGMSVFVEPDGTEALYVSGVSARFIGYGDAPPPRILRSVDGVHFEPLPQDPGTVLGDFSGNGFRSQTSVNGRFYVSGGTILGSGVVLEATDPAQGNDNFRVITPSDMDVMVLEAFNDHLYIGTRDVRNGYSVIKTRPLGNPPYRFRTVVPKGGYLTTWRNPEVLSMKVFKNRLYVGGNGLVVGRLGLFGPAELIAIDPDDNWDLIVGYPRETPDGWKFPTSGLSAGFGNFLNGHIWQMEVHDDTLYIGTFDSSSSHKDSPSIEPYLKEQMGFDLYRTTDGANMVPITTNGFGNPFAFGLRTLSSTPYGLFIGTTNSYYGLEIWRAARAFYTQYLPQIGGSSAAPPVTTSTDDAPLVVEPGITDPKHLKAELVDNRVLLSWTNSAAINQVRIQRMEMVTKPLPELTALLKAFQSWVQMQDPETLQQGNFIEQFDGAIDEVAAQSEITGTFQSAPVVIGVTSDSFFADDTAVPGKHYLYYVEAIDANGHVIGTSNLAEFPPVTSSAGLMGDESFAIEPSTSR